MISTLFASTCAKVAGGIGLAALIVIGILWGSLAAANADRDDLRQRLASERAKHDLAINERDSLADIIDQIQAEALERAAAYEMQKLEAAEREEELRKLAKNSDERIAALRRIANQKGPGCPVPDELRRLAEGL